MHWGEWWGEGAEVVLISVLNTWLASVLGSETFHADAPCPALTLHLAGNLLVLSDGSAGFIDFGRAVCSSADRPSPLSRERY